VSQFFRVSRFLGSVFSLVMAGERDPKSRRAFLQDCWIQHTVSNVFVAGRFGNAEAESLGKVHNER
jgi:hypothetical protein